MVEEAETELFEVSQHNIKHGIVSLESILAERFDRLDELHKDKNQMRGIPTGFVDLDKMLAGLQRSDLIVLAARPSLGKTALALNIAHKITTEAKQPVLIFSLKRVKSSWLIIYWRSSRASTRGR